MSKISAVINVVEEELEVLPQALSSVQDFVAEIVIVDMSESGVPDKLVKKYKLKVYKHKHVSYVEPVRNFGIEKAKGEWILILDPDEELPKTLAKKLNGIVIEKGKIDFYRLPRKNIVFGKWLKHSRWWPDHIIRFFRKGTVIWDEILHSVPSTSGRGADLEVLEENALIHHHYVSVEQYLERMNRYTTAQAKEKVKTDYKFSWRDLIKKPTGEFLSRYFFGQGYKDGLHGLAVAGLQGLSEFVVYLKAWFYSDKKHKSKHIKLGKVIGEMRKAEKEFHYWQADALVKEGGGIVQRVKRKFKLR